MCVTLNSSFLLTARAVRGRFPQTRHLWKRVSSVLDVLTALSDCRHETVEKIMERRISGVSYMCWIDFHNGIWGCGLLCTPLISFYFFFYFTANTPRATTPHLYITGYHAEGYHAPSIPLGLSRLYHHCTATTPVYIFPGYHAIVLSSIPGLSHLSYHAPPRTYIGLSHPT